MTELLPDTTGRRLHTLLSRLECVTPRGEGRWDARCPAHDDRSPSLSIRSAGESILIHCFAGCDPGDVLAAVGLSWRDLFADPWDAARLRPNEGARRYALRPLDPLELERQILRIAATDIRAGRALSIEDRARIHLARERVENQHG